VSQTTISLAPHIAEGKYTTTNFYETMDAIKRYVSVYHNIEYGTKSRRSLLQFFFWGVGSKSLYYRPLEVDIETFPEARYFWKKITYHYNNNKVLALKASIPNDKALESAFYYLAESMEYRYENEPCRKPDFQNKYIIYNSDYYAYEVDTLERGATPLSKKERKICKAEHAEVQR
jgi:hypothetical protein